MNPLAAELLAVLDRYVDDKIDERLAARGQLDPSTEYSSRKPLPPKVSARAFRNGARSMLKAGVPGVRCEGKGTRDRVYLVRVQAWHAWRTTSRVERRAEGTSDAELAADALTGAGLRVVRGGRR